MALNYYMVGYKNPDRRQRYDVPFPPDYPLFREALLNKRNPNKGGHSFNFRSGIPDRFKVDEKRKGDFCMSRGGNISSVYWPNKVLPYAWGDVHHPISKIVIPDGLIWILSPDLKTVEVFVALCKRNTIRQVYQMVCDGLLDHEIAFHRSNYESGSAA